MVLSASAFIVTHTGVWLSKNSFDSFLEWITSLKAFLEMFRYPRISFRSILSPTPLSLPSIFSSSSSSIFFIFFVVVVDRDQDSVENK